MLGRLAGSRAALHPGASALKLYRRVPCSAASGVRAELGAAERTEQRLIGLLCGDPASGSWPPESDGFMVQQRYTAAGSGPTKVYRTFPYQTPGLALDPADKLVHSVAEEFGGRRSLAALEALGPALGGTERALYPTSVGVSFDPELGCGRYGTAYWEILRPGRA
jgi:hypothetical protein